MLSTVIHKVSLGGNISHSHQIVEWSGTVQRTSNQIVIRTNLLSIAWTVAKNPLVVITGSKDRKEVLSSRSSGPQPQCIKPNVTWSDRIAFWWSLSTDRVDPPCHPNWSLRWSLRLTKWSLRWSLKLTKWSHRWLLKITKWSLEEASVYEKKSLYLPGESEDIPVYGKNESTCLPGNSEYNQFMKKQSAYLPENSEEQVCLMKKRVCLTLPGTAKTTSYETTSLSTHLETAKTTSLWNTTPARTCK